MAFVRTGQVPIEGVYCSCGGLIENGVCTKCKKEKMPKDKAPEKPMDVPPHK